MGRLRAGARLGSRNHTRHRDDTERRGYCISRRKEKRACIYTSTCGSLAVEAEAASCAYRGARRGGHDEWLKLGYIDRIHIASIMQLHQHFTIEPLPSYLH